MKVFHHFSSLSSREIKEILASSKWTHMSLKQFDCENIKVGSSSCCRVCEKYICSPVGMTNWFHRKRAIKDEKNKLNMESNVPRVVWDYKITH